MSNAIAVSVAPGEVRLMVARANGAVKPRHQLSAALPDGVVRAGLQAPNLADPDAIVGPLTALAGEAEALGRGTAMVAVLIPDAAVRVALTPLDGGEPRRAEGDAMARWALADLLPLEPADARIDWAPVGANGAEVAPGWLLAIGAATAVVREYEAVVEAVGWIPGRVVPFTMALAVDADGAEAGSDPGAARVVLSGVGGQVACLVEAGGVPRFHRAWRGAHPDLDLELRALQRYVDTRLDLSIADAVVAGPESWRTRAATQCRALGWRVRERSDWSAHLAAVQP